MWCNNSVISEGLLSERAFKGLVWKAEFNKGSHEGSNIHAALQKLWM